MNLDLEVRALLSEKISESGRSLGDVSLALGRDRGYLARKLRGDRSLSISELSAIIEELDGLSVDSFLILLLDRLAPTRQPASTPQAPLEIPPSYYAKLLRNALPSPLNSEENARIAKAVPEYFLEPIPPDFNAEVPASFRQQISEINSHPRVAYEIIEAKVMEAARKPPTSAASILEHALLLAAWAISARRTGHLRLASAITAKGLELHGAANLSSTYMPLLRGAAIVFYELGERALAIGTAQHALLLSKLREDVDGQVRSVLALSNIYTAYGMKEEAVRVLATQESTPSKLKFSICLNLSILQLQAGRPALALGTLEQAKPGDRRERLYSKWALAQILAKLDNSRDALGAYEELLKDSAGFFQPDQKLAIFLELVPLLRNKGEPEVTRVFCANFLPDLERLEMNKAAKNLRDDVITAATRGFLREGIEGDYRKSLLQDS